VRADRKTVRRYVEAAQGAGLERGGGDEALTDELLGAMAEQLQSGRPRHLYGEAWRQLEGERAFLKAKLDAGLRLTKVHDLLARRGVLVPYRTLHRFCASELEFGGQRKTVPVADGEPGHELQVDFGRMGLLRDGPEGRRRQCTPVRFDRQLWNELCSLRFLQDASCVLILGPVGVGKTMLANCLGHIAARCQHSVLMSRTERLLKRLKAARLEGAYDQELRLTVRSGAR
jgi:hypothetical protein